MNIKRVFLFLFLLIISFSPLFGVNITIMDVKGKVEIRQPGRDWEPAVSGAVLSMNTTISTGFNSEAVLEIENSRTTIQPLTRLTVDEIDMSDNRLKTSLFLGAGTVRAEVKQASEYSTDFSIRTPVATAAVRGTEFTFDPNKLSVSDGIVSYESGGFRIFVHQGGTSSIVGAVIGMPFTDPYDAAMADRRVSPVAGDSDAPETTDTTSRRRSKGAAGGSVGQPVVSIR